MITSVRDPVEFLGDQKDRAALQEWYETLNQSAVKTSVQTVKCREFRPYNCGNFRLIVLCNHPFGDLSSELDKARNVGDHLKSDRTLSTLISSFTQWVESHHVPTETMLDKRRAFIDWWPKEMLHYVAHDLSPEAQAHVEMSNHILECLDLVRLATVSGPEFLGLWIDSNEPYFAAGRLFYGTFKWVDEVPIMGNNHTARMQLREHVSEFAREFVGLARLALLAGAESPLLDRTIFILRKFKIQFSAEIPAWLALAQELLEGSEHIPTHAAIAIPTEYERLDCVCDGLRTNLAKAAEGLEHEIPALINALLPTLTVPISISGEGKCRSPQDFSF